MGENVLKFGTYVRVGNAAEAYELLQKNRNNKIVGGSIYGRFGFSDVLSAFLALDSYRSEEHTSELQSP